MDCSSSHHRLSKAIGGVFPSPATSTLQISPPPSYTSFETPPPPFADQVLPAFPPAPPASQLDRNPRADTILSTATHVLTTEATALSSLSRLYTTNPQCRDGFVRAVEAIVMSQERGGKIIVVGVGKSGKIGDKLVASMNSMGLMSVFLNPVEALHGDLGIVRKDDVVLLITFSGNTPELLQLIPHLPAQLTLVALTSRDTLSLNRDLIILPTPIPEPEAKSFGVAAPTTSTTVAMALGDALVLSVAYRIHGAEGMSPKEVFQRNHPGGAIGMLNKKATATATATVTATAAAAKKPNRESMRALAVPVDEIPIADARDLTTTAAEMMPSPTVSETSSESDVDLEWSTNSNNACASSIANNNNNNSSNKTSRKACCSNLRVLDCLRLAVKSPRGWLRTADGGIIPPGKLSACHHLLEEVNSPDLGLVLDLKKLTAFSPDHLMGDVVRMLRSSRAPGSVVAVVEGGRVIGVVEVGNVVGRATPVYSSSASAPS